MKLKSAFKRTLTSVYTWHNRWRDKISKIYLSGRLSSKLDFVQTDANVTQVAGDTESSEQLLTKAEKSDIKDHPEDFLNPDETYTSFSGNEADQIAEAGNDEESASSRFSETTISNSQPDPDDEASHVARHINLYESLAL